jgi:AraC-like DNA-binding protein
VRQPLENFVLIDSGDVEDVRTSLSGLYGDVRFHARVKRQPSRLRIHSRSKGCLTISYVRSVQAFRMHITCSDHLFLVGLPYGERSAVRADSSRVLVEEPGGWVSNPGADREISLSQTSALLLVGIDRSALQRRLGALLGQALPHPLAFDDSLDVARRPLNGWYQGLQLYIKSLDDRRSVLEHGAAADSVQDAILTTFLVSHRHNYWDVVQGSSDLVPSRSIREATRLIESQPDHQHSVTSLADAVGVSVRALERGFRRHLDVTPHNYLREVRLRRARQDLEVSNSDYVTVAEVARRYGFFHFGRFAATYRDRFGEAPSDTLRSR